VTANNGLTLGRGKMSAASVGWRVGWRGMEWVAKLGMYRDANGFYLSEIGIATGEFAAACSADDGYLPGSDPIPESTTPFCKLCCDAAKRDGQDAADWGGVVCCNGRKCTCSWYMPGDWPCEGGDRDPNRRRGCDWAERVLVHCIHQHERSHEPDVSCTGCDPAKPCRPPWSPGSRQNVGECAAYCLELNCLRSKRRLCSRNNPAEQSACESIIDKMIASRCGYLKEYCNAARGWNPDGTPGLIDERGRPVVPDVSDPAAFRPCPSQWELCK